MKNIKRFFLMAAAVWMLMSIILFCGCEKNSVIRDYPPMPPEKFETDVVLTADKEEITAHLSYHGFGNCVIEFTGPENLKGLSAVWQDSKCILSYNNLSYTADLEGLPESFFGKAAPAVFDKLADVESFTVVKENDKWIYKGEIASGEFRLVQDSQSGAFETLEVPGVSVAVKFLNFKEIKE